MGFYYVTGVTGVGKSTVCKELARRGHEAYDGDNLSAFYHNKTNEKIAGSVPSDKRTPEWRMQHEWKMSVDMLHKLRTNAANGPVFVCGVTSNEDEYLGIFDKIFALTVDRATLGHRLDSRSDKKYAYGKSEHERAEVLAWQEHAEEGYRQKGAVIVDATRSLDRVVDEILTHTKTDQA